MLAIAQQSFALVQLDLRFRPKNVVAKTIGDIGKLVARQANHASIRHREFRIVSSNDRFSSRRLG
jgi:hypothetical protein